MAHLDQVRTGLKLRSRIHRFFDSAVIFALADLAVFQALAEAPSSAEDLSRRLSVDSNRLSRLLRAASGLELLQRRDDGCYQIPAELQPFLGSTTGVQTLLPWIRFIQSVSPGLFSLAEAVRGNSLQASERDFCLRGADLDAFSRAMHLYACTLGSELPRFFNLSKARSLLDLACGSGTYAFLLAQKFPHLRLGLMDEERVLDVARRTASEFGLDNPIQFISGDVLIDSIPGGFDAILISNLLHLIGPAASRELIRRCFDALEPGGSLGVQAQFLREDESQRGWPVMLDLILLTGSAQGRNHTRSETIRWLEMAGFTGIEFEPMSLVNVNSLIRGYKRR